MGLEELKREILEKASAEAGRIIKEGESEAWKIAKDTDSQIKDLRDKSDAETSKLIESMERKEVSGAEFDAKKAKLDRKKEMVEKAFSNAVKALSDMPDKKREQYLKKLVEKAKKEIDVSFVYANSDDRKIVEKMSGVKYKQADISGGIIAENKDGSIRVDYSYDELLDSIKKESMQEIAEKLFGR
ncbi:MAG: V-type ATP synthase subunit E family protein [Candidatus Woesearchaeota archaeon]|nr:V-type ATP synthase subunit E family protein [Candidatus Woesearchaeota archaeon]